MSTDLNLALIAAAWNNDLVTAEELIRAGADVNYRDSTVQSAFLITTSEGFHEFLLLTLANGADVQAKDSYNGTGLIRAADRGHAQIIGTLLQEGTEVNHINNLGWTALHEAIILGNGDQRYQDCVRLVFAGGADPLLPSQSDGVSPLQHAESSGFAKISTTLRTVIETPAPSEPDDALQTAVVGANADAATVALRAGADPGQAVGTAQEAANLSADHAAVARLILFLTQGTGPASPSA